MKKAFATILTIIGLSATPLLAQSTIPMHFETPFEFSVGDQTLPAGEYTIETVGLELALQVRSMDNKQIATVVTHLTSRPAVQEQGKLVFHR